MQNINRVFNVIVRKFKIATRLFLLQAIIIAVIFCGTLLFSEFVIKQISNQFLYHYLQSEQSIVSDNLSLYLEEVIMTSLRYKSNLAFYRIAEDPTLSKEEKMNAFREEASSIQSPVQADIANIYLIDKEENIYLINGDKELSLSDFDSWKQDSNHPFYNVGELCYDIDQNYYIPISMDFYNYQSFKSIGRLVFCLPVKPISELFHQLFSESDRIFLVDESGKVLSNNENKYIGTYIQDFGITLTDESFSAQDIRIDDENCVAVVTELADSNSLIGFSWSLYTIIPYRILYQNIEHIQSLLLTSIIIAMVLSFLFSLHYSKKLSGAIKRLSKKISLISEDKLKDFFNPSPRDELWELEQGYNEMLVRINDLLEKNKQEQIKRRELEFSALQAEINPHFLYNTLDTIGWIATLKKQPEIEQIVMELSRFFRLSLHKGDQWVTLEDELGIVSSYVKIEQLRNPGKFDVDYDVQEDLLQLKVPKIILQPVVENAIKHGISQVRRHGQISIRGYRIGDDVYLEVQDNGSGFQNKNSQLHGSNYGLKNIRERIQLEFGEQYGLSIMSREGEGTTVQIHICFKE